LNRWFLLFWQWVCEFSGFLKNLRVSPSGGINFFKMCASMAGVRRGLASGVWGDKGGRRDCGARIDGWLDGWMVGWLDGWMVGLVDGRIGGRRIERI